MLAPQSPLFDVIVIGASSGGLHALGRVLAPLPEWFPTPIVVVQHLAPDGPSYLPRILNGLTELSVEWAREGEALKGGRVYVAPPARHLLLNTSHRCVLSAGEPVNYARPAVDPLFESAASSFGASVLGVVLTGRLRDAAAGAGAIRRAGGLVIAQSPESCTDAGMPRAAIEAGNVDFVIDVSAIASALVSLVVLPGAASSSDLRHDSA